jgi:hypothetical protein
MLELNKLAVLAPEGLNSQVLRKSRSGPASHFLKMLGETVLDYASNQTLEF